MDAKGWLLSYFAVPIVLLFEFAGSNIRLLCLGTGRRIPNIHNHLLRSADVADFWRRYNVWVSDWFHEILFRPLRRRRLLASLRMFVFSGLSHEVFINLPLFTLFHVNLFGSTAAYFFIQWLAVAIDHVYLKGRSRLRRVFLYLAVVGPAPLIINESLLRVFGWYR
jgi:D-alanyl-lipoteichoic acid acyltransferase DltB (MBOAT superfamily)